MSITDRQKKIINPYAETLDTPERRGIGYDYNNRRNRFIQDAIQERYIYFFQFPKINEPLRVKAEDNIENPQIQEADLLAYFALYPQNGKVIGGEATEIGDDESILQLQTLATQLADNEVLGKYTSKTSEVSYLEEYQSRQNIANLIAIPAGHSNTYRNKLRQAFALPNYQYSGEADLNSISLSPRASTYVITDTNVDLYDWRQNCLPGDKDKTYYNTVDRNYYFTRRTDEPSLGYLNFNFNTMRMASMSEDAGRRAEASSLWDNTSEEGKTLYATFVNEAIKEILQSAGKYSTDNYQSLVERYSAPTRFALYTDLNRRPGSRWTYAVKIDGQDIESLPSPDSVDPSREETEITTLEKAKRIIGDTNQSSNSIEFQVEDLIRYIFFTRNLLREYDKKLFDLNLGPENLNDIDLGAEVDRLNSFFSLLELFYNYNKISIQDSDFVQMYFTDDYRLDHVVINGSFYYQGTGGRTYLNEEVEAVRVINAFSIFTATTFSIIKNSQQIYNESRNASSDNRKNVLDFMSEYLFPQIDLEDIKLKQGKASRLEKQRAARRKKVFERYSRLTKGDPKEFEFLYSNRPLKYTISSTLNNMDCNTGQVAAARYALKFWQAATSKTKLQSVIREAIILLRDEAVEDETTKRRLTQAAAYAENPDRVSRDIENYINQQIFCSLDVIGDFIEDQFLDPLGLPPEPSRLTRNTIDSIPKIEFKKCSMTSAKARQSVLYQKMLETILLNFVKSIVAGIAKDFIRALLGCGPNDPNIELTNNFRKEDYGFVDLTELLYGIDIVEIAAIVGLQNIQEQNIDGNISTERTPATREQLESFISDISKMSTPVELQQLLNGDGSNDLLEHLLETTSGTKDIGDNFIDVDVYNTFDLRVDRIRNYFIAIGDALDGTLDNLGEMGFVSPLEAYCNKKDGFINPLTLDFSVPEIEEQYNDIVSSKINKINNLCSFLRDLTNIELEIERLIDSLPSLEWYDTLLQDIANLSNQFAEWLAGFFSDLFGREQTTRQQPEYNLYNSEMGTELFYQIFFSLREVLINQLYFATEEGTTTTYFQTPAGFNGRRIGFRGTIELNLWGEDDVQIKGNFGARKNQHTRDNVYKFIWSDSRTTNYVSPNRINIPQYRNPIVPPNDYLDASYYSLRNSPEELVEELVKSPNLLSPNNIKRIQYGEPRSYAEGFNFNRILQTLGNLGNDNNEIGYLVAFANRVYQYLKEVENRIPYEGWTGATYLRCANNAGGNIRIFYNSTPEGQLDEVSTFLPDVVYNEVSTDSRNIPINEQNYELIDYRLYNGIEFDGSSISVSNTNTLTIDNVQMPVHAAGATSNLYGNLSIGLLSDRLNNEGQEFSLYNRYKDILLFQNYTTRIDTLIDNSVINDRGKRILPRYIAALNKPALQKTDDICVTAEDIIKGEAGLRKLQANMFSFFMNIMPMASAYPNWRSAGTVEMITDYLTRKFVDDLRDKQILGSFYELIPFIRMVYPHIQGDEEFIKNPIILDELSPLENTKNIVKAVYVGTLDNISETSEYSNVNKSIFDPSDNLGRYKKLLGNFYRRIVESGDDLVDYLPIRQRQNSEEVRQVLRTLYTGDNVSNTIATDKGVVVGTYYFPVAFQIASYMIYMDRGVRYSERYVDTKYRMLVEEAAVDDSVLTAIKGQLVEQFSPTYAGFPVKVTGWGGIPVIYYNSTQAERRIITLDQINDSFQSEEGFGYLSLNQLLDLDPGTLAQAYPDFFSIDALLDARGLYPNRRVIPQDQVEEIRRQILARTWTLMDSLKRIINNTGNNSRQQYVEESILAKFVGSGPPVATEDGVLTYFEVLVNEDDDVRRTSRHLLNSFIRNNRQVVSNIETFQQDLPENIGDLIPTIRTDSLYFQSLGDIFRGFGQGLTIEQNNGGTREVRASQFSPYFIAPDPYEYGGFLPIPPGAIEGEDEEEIREAINEVQRRVNPNFADQVEIQYQRNQAYGHAQRFFYEYLYNKYANYRADQVKILEEKNQLEKLINRNE